VEALKKDFPNLKIIAQSDLDLGISAERNCTFDDQAAALV
jgi:hypothetical protein